MANINEYLGRGLGNALNKGFGQIANTGGSSFLRQRDIDSLRRQQAIRQTIPTQSMQFNDSPLQQQQQPQQSTGSALDEFINWEEARRQQEQDDNQKSQQQISQDEFKKLSQSDVGLVEPSDNAQGMYNEPEKKRSGLAQFGQLLSGLNDDELGEIARNYLQENGDPREDIAGFLLGDGFSQVRSEFGKKRRENGNLNILDQLQELGSTGEKYWQDRSAAHGDQDIFTALREAALEGGDWGRVAETGLNTLKGLPAGMASIAPGALAQIADNQLGYTADADDEGGVELRAQDPSQRLASGASTALDFVELFPAAKGATTAAKGGAGILKNLIGTGAKTGLSEGITETLQTGLDAYSEGESASFDDYGNAFLGGVLGGGAFGGASAGVGSVVGRGRKNAALDVDNSTGGVDASSVDASMDASGLTSNINLGEKLAQAQQQMSPEAIGAQQPLMQNEALPGMEQQIDPAAAALQQEVASVDEGPLGTLEESTQLQEALSEKTRELGESAEALKAEEAAPQASVVEEQGSAGEVDASQQSARSSVTAPPPAEGSRATTAVIDPTIAREARSDAYADAPSENTAKSQESTLQQRAETRSAAVETARTDPTSRNVNEAVTLAVSDLIQARAQGETAIAGQAEAQIYNVLEAYAETQVVNAERVKSGELSTTQATDMVVQEWYNKITDDPSFISSTSRPTYALGKDPVTKVSNILAQTAQAQEQTSTMGTTDSLSSESSQNPASAETPAQSTQATSQQSQSMNSTQQVKSASQQRSETNGKNSSTQSQENRSTSSEVNATQDQRSQRSTETEQSRSQGETVSETISEVSDAGSRDYATVSDVRTGKVKQSQTGVIDYETKSIGLSEASVESYLQGKSEKQVAQFIEDILSGELVLDTAQTRQLINMIETGDAKVSKKYQKAKMLREINAKAASDSAQNLRMYRSLQVEQLVSGVATETDIRAYVDSIKSKNDIQTTQTGIDALDQAIAQYTASQKPLADAKEFSSTIANTAQPTKRQIADAQDAINEAYRDTQRAVSAINNSILDEIANIPDTATRREASFAFETTLKENFGLYFQNYVDSNLLSNISGRVYDAAHGVFVSFEEGSPLTRGVIDPAVKFMFGTSAGISSYRGLVRGSASGIADVARNARDRQSYASGGRVGNRVGATVRNATTTVAEFGDFTNRGLADSKTAKYYKDTRGVSEAQANLLATLDRLGDVANTDGVHKMYSAAAAFEQGLGSSSRRVNTAIKQKFAASLAEIDALNGHPRLRDNITTVIDRTVFGFWGSMNRIGFSGLSRATGGVPRFIKTMRTTKPGTPERAAGIRRALLDAKSGVELAGLGFAMSAAGLVSGAYPDDPGERAEFVAQGKTEYSINIGGNWISLPRALGVFYLPFMTGANIEAGAYSDKSPGELIGRIFEDATQIFGIDSLDSAINTLATISDDVKQGNLSKTSQNFVAGVVKMLLPLNSLHNQIASAADDYQRDSSDVDGIVSIGKRIASATFARFLLPVKTDWAGNELQNVDFIAKLYGASSTEQNRNDAVYDELARLDALGLNVTPPKQNEHIELANKEWAELTNEQQMVLNDAIAAEKFLDLETLINSKFYVGTDEEKAELLNNAIGSNTSAVKARLAKEWGFDDYISSVNEVYGVHRDLDPEFAAAIVAHDSAQDSDAWLNDPVNGLENSYNYHMGVYKNAELNGTLTDADKNLQFGGTSTLIYKAKEAEFNYQNNIDPYLSNMYKEVSLTEWREMLESDDPEEVALAEALYSLDEARKEAGISRKDSNHSKNKYYLKDSKKSGGYGGRRGGGGGGGGSDRLHVPTVADLTSKAFKPSGTTSSTSTSTKAASVEPISYSKSAVGTTAAKGGGIKTTPRNFQGASTVKYQKSTTKQPNRGKIAGATKSPQDNFSAARKYL